MANLDGQVAIVTGAARGIGSAIATRLAADGARVVINYSTSAKPAEQTVEAITKAGGKAVAIQADVSDAGAIGKLFDAAEKAFGPVTILVNNAGVYEERLLEKADQAHFDKLFHANVLGPLLATAEFARRFKGKAGRVVNISSGGARGALPGAGVYCASKAAVEGLTRVHALELGSKGITVNSVAPGVTETEMLKQGLPEEIKKHMIGNTILGRLGQPDDIADVVAFFCSHDARWITGQFIDASGGLRV
jgi:3-oxoacyl-[acyl-carrier protein] reductase